MTLTRYQIRNEYGLASKEIYQAADKEDPEALLESSSMAGLVGVLRQLGDLADFAAEVFHCLHEELLKTAARGNGLTTRLQKLEAEFPSIEIPILSQTDHSTFFYDPGLEWHSNLQTKENLIASRNLPRCIMDSYEESRGPPQLFLLEKFDVAGSGSCLKRYSDPSFFKKSSASTVVETSKHSKEERLSRKPKKKASQMIGEETNKEASRTSHSKLHQLFLLEHVDNGDINPEFHMQLKRRQLNGPQVNSSSGTSYMEKFLKISSPYCERVHRTMDQSSPAMETEVTVCSVGEDLSNSGDTIKQNEMEMKSIADDDDDERLEITSNEKSLRDIEEGPVICLERSSSVNNDTDATVSMESEAKEAEGDDKVDSNVAFPGFAQTQICSNEDETQTEVLNPFSNCLQHALEKEEEDEEASPLCTDSKRSSFSENPPNILEDSESRLELQSNETELKSSEACKIGRDSMLTQMPQDVYESKTEVLLTNYVEDNHQSQHLFSVETESEVSLSGLIEDHQFSSITSREIKALESKDISSEASLAIPDSQSSLEETHLALESDCRLSNQYISPFYTVEDSSDDAKDNVVPKGDETNSQDGPSMDTEHSGHISTSEICSENGTLISDSPRVTHTGNGELLASLCLEDALANPDMAAVSSSSIQEDSQTMSIVADELEVPIPDTHFVENQACLNNIATETEPEKDLENISYHPQESLLATQECHSSEYCIESRDQEQETPSETESADPITESAVSLPYQVSTQECISSECCIEIQDKEQENSSEIGSTDLITESAESLPTQEVPSMDLADREKCEDVDVSSESMVPFSIPFPETAQIDSEIMPPLPPLPPTQWLMGKLTESVKTTASVPSLAGTGNNINTEENIQNGSVQASSENHDIHVCTEETTVEEEEEEEDISTAAETTLNERLNKTMEESFASSISLLKAEATTPEKEEEESHEHEGLEEESDWRSEAMALEWFSQNLREQSNPQPPQETNSFDEKQRIEKLSREKDSLVIGIDRSMLRKVSERNREARVDENDSLLEIIRSKSFNLRPADASARPKFQVAAAAPVTNFKVAAILEKANTLRQAMAGSDDEHDSDSWSE